jgi:superfamily II DNA helicase RecQ
MVATNALGMGIDIPQLYYMWDLMFSLTIADFFQALGRLGRDGKKSYACAYRGLNVAHVSKCMRGLLNSTDKCLRLIMARHFDPTVDPARVRDMQPGQTDAEKAASCCRICADRGHMYDPNPTTCPSGCLSTAIGHGIFCSVAQS